MKHLRAGLDDRKYISFALGDGSSRKKDKIKVPEKRLRSMEMASFHLQMQSTHHAAASSSRNKEI